MKSINKTIAIVILIPVISICIYFVLPKKESSLPNPVIYEKILKKYIKNDKKDYIDYEKFNKNENFIITMINNKKSSLEFYMTLKDQKNIIIYFHNDSINYYSKESLKTRAINFYSIDN